LFSGWGGINNYSVSFVFCTHKPPVLTHTHKYCTPTHSGDGSY